MECLQRGTVESDEEARVYFEQALAADPQFARAQAGLSLSHFNEWSCQAWECWEAKEKAAYECARRAEALGWNWLGPPVAMERKLALSDLQHVRRI